MELTSYGTNRKRGTRYVSAKTPQELLVTWAQAARALTYMRDELDLSEATYNELMKNIRRLANECQR